MDTLLKLFRSLIEYIPLWIFLTVMRLFKYKKRVIIGSFIISFVIRKIPKFRKRVFDNLELIFPSFSKEDKNKFLKEFANNLGLTFIEFLFNGEYHQLQKIKLQSESQCDEI